MYAVRAQESNCTFIEYDFQDYFDRYGHSWMCLINSGNIKNILKTHKNLINNISSANTLKESLKRRILNV